MTPTQRGLAAASTVLSVLLVTGVLAPQAVAGTSAAPSGAVLPSRLSDGGPLPTDVAVVPGEFEPVRTTLIAWALNDQDSAELRAYFVNLVRAASENSRVVVFGDHPGAADDARTSLTDADVDTSELHFVDSSLDSWWIRDYGPIAARTTDGGKRFISTRYHADRPQDDAFATALAARWSVPVTRADLGTEGGNFLSDGTGGCLVTNAILKNPYNVTNHVTAQDVRTMFRSLYGCQETTFLDPLKGEVTGHVDMFTSFTGNRDVLVGAYSPSDDPDNAAVLDADAARLTTAGYHVRRIPMPTHRDGVFRSYANSLAVNGAVLVPVYTDDTTYEETALDTYRDAFPDRRIVPIDATAVIKTRGAVHCTTMTIADH
ncbi:agmatine deiminase family protein [Kitasatospora sp. NPDC059088]|uniref:agmatine deiminase family protein n=1 Tax=Kitasatospora sp. NPDC059088 TaxID=3346722 RepID=UPI00367CDDFC